MKNVKIKYWVLTGMASAFMVMSAIPDLLAHPEAIEIFKHLGYPSYLLPFLGTLKILASLIILIPISHKLKEWAYAGILIDLVGALYSHLSVGDNFSEYIFAIIGLLLVTGSYLLFSMKNRANGVVVVDASHLTKK